MLKESLWMNRNLLEKWVTLEFRVHIPKIKVDTPFCTGTVEAMCMKDSPFDLIIGNVSGAKKPNNPIPDWGVVAAAILEHKRRNEESSSH